MTLLDLNKKELSTLLRLVSDELKNSNQKLLEGLSAKLKTAEHDEQIIAGICSECDESIFHGEDWEFSSVGTFSQHHTNCYI